MPNSNNLQTTGAIEPNFIFTALFVAHLLAAVIISIIYILRKIRHDKREALVRDTIDALLDEHEHDSAETTQTTDSLAETNSSEDNNQDGYEFSVETIIDKLNALSQASFVEYLGRYFEAADYTIDIHRATSTKSSTPTSYLSIELRQKRGLILTDQPKTGITGLPLVRAFHTHGYKSLRPQDSLILVTTGSLSPKASEYIQAADRPLIVITGHQLASSIQKMDMPTPGEE